MKKVCVDNDVLGWFVKGNASEEQKGDQEKAVYLFDWFSEQNIRVVIPSIVVAEQLSDIEDSDERERVSDFINDNYDVLQYDMLSARVFAEIQVEKNKERAALAKHRSENNILKCKMKNDWNIASCAISNNCDAIFSNNSSDFKTFVGDKIPVFDLTFVDKIKEDLAEAERVEKEAKEKEIEESKTIKEGEMFPANLEGFETASEARLEKTARLTRLTEKGESEEE